MSTPTNENEVEYLYKFIEKYDKCILPHQTYLEHLALRIELIEYILNCFQTNEYNFVKSPLIFEHNYQGIIKDLLFGKYTIDDFEIFTPIIDTSQEFAKKERIIMELSQYAGTLADLKRFK